MCERVVNAYSQQRCDFAQCALAMQVIEIAPNGVDPQRHRQTCSTRPPSAEVFDQMQTRALECELSFVNDQPRRKFAAANTLDDLLERHDLMSHHSASEHKLRHRERAGALAGNREHDLRPLEIINGHWLE